MNQVILTIEQIQRLIVARREAIDKYNAASEMSKNMPAGRDKDSTSHMASIYFGNQRAYEHALDICGIIYFG